MNKFFRAALGLLGAGVIALGISTVVAPAASAASAHPAGSCNDNGCYGADPYASGCDQDAYTLADVTDPNGAYLELWYSPSCHADWAEISDGYSGEWVEVQNGAGDYEGYTLDSQDYGYGITYMVGDDSSAEASDPYVSTGWR